MYLLSDYKSPDAQDFVTIGTYEIQSIVNDSFKINVSFIKNTSLHKRHAKSKRHG